MTNTTNTNVTRYSGGGASSHFNNSFENLLRNGGSLRLTGNLGVDYSIERNQLSSSPSTNPAPIGSTNPTPAARTHTYLWGTEEDNSSASISQSLQTQTSKLQKAIDFHEAKQATMLNWLHHSGVVRNMTDAEVIQARFNYDVAMRSEDFYRSEQQFTSRVEAEVSSVQMSPALSAQFIATYDQLDNLRDNYDRNLQLGIGGDAFGTNGFIAKLELDKAKFLIEEVMLKGGTIDDVNRFTKTFDDQISAARNSIEAKNAGRLEEAKMWDFISGKVEDLREQYLGSLLNASTAANPNAARVTASAQFFDNNYATLTGRIQSSMLTAIQGGSSFANLMNVKANPQDLMTIGEEFDNITTSLVDYANNNRPVAQIMAEKALAALNYDGANGMSNQEMIGAIMDATRLQSSRAYDIKFDLNNDGIVNDADLNYLRQVASQQNSSFNNATRAVSLVDANNDGTVSLTEARTTLTAFQTAYANRAHPTATHLLMDLDGNGSISLDDFKLITDILTRRSSLGPNITGLSSASTNPIDSVLRSIANGQANLASSLEAVNTALDSFDNIEGNLTARTELDRDFRYARWAADLGDRHQADDLWRANALMVAPNRLNGREAEYSQRITALNNAHNALNESVLDAGDYWRDIRVKKVEYTQQRAATNLLVRGASTTDVARVDRLYDFYQELDTDSTNYRYGYNINLSGYVAGATAGNNPTNIRNQVLADFSAQQGVQINRLIQAQNANINKLDAAKTTTFNTGFDRLMTLHNQMEQRLLANVSAGVSLTDPQYLTLRNQFDAYVTAMNNLLTTGTWQAPANP